MCVCCSYWLQGSSSGIWWGGYWQGVVSQASRWRTKRLRGGAETGSAVSPPEWQIEVPTCRTLSQRKETSLSKEESLPLFFISPVCLLLLDRTVRLGQVGGASLTMFVLCNFFVPSSEKLETFSTENYQKLCSVLWEQERREKEVGEGVGELCVDLMMNPLLGTLLPMQGWPILPTRGPSVPTLITWGTLPSGIIGG